MTLMLGTIAAVAVATAEDDGWWLRPAESFAGELGRREVWSDQTPERDRDAAASEIELLLDQEIAEVVGRSVRIPWERFAAALSTDIQLPVRWTTWSPLMLSIDRVSELGRRDFRYKYDYRVGANATHVERYGYFVQRTATGQIYHLDEQTFGLVDAMDRFNALPESERGGDGAWLTFATVKGCSVGTGATLDRHLADNDVVVPPQISLDVLTHEDDSISFVPKVPGIRDEDLQRAFLRNRDAQGLYSLDGPDGRRVRVVLSDRQKEVLSRMKQVRRVRGAVKDRARANPEQYFDGLLDAVEIQYGPRVVGIGDRVFAAVPANPQQSGGFLEGSTERRDGDQAAEEGERTGRAPRNRPSRVLLPSARPDGSPGADVVVVFRNDREVAAAREIVADAISQGQTSTQIGAHVVVASPEVLEALEQQPSDRSGVAKGRRYLLVYTNEEDLRDADSAAARRASERVERWPATPTLPSALTKGVALKPHQLDSLLWLQRCDVIPDRRGVLLADDMGLGKTLQILTFLARRIEQGRLKVSPDQHVDLPPWRPILIVAPLILVENETWIGEMRRFFENQGAIFDPVLTLHGPGVDSVRASSSRGTETAAGRPLLDASKLMRYRVVITNYETVVNYQHSLAQLIDGRSIWSAIVTDEAQKYKALDTKISFALKAIPSEFHIASTGTPVENRLLDLWNIVDTIQPALLGSAADFNRRFEQRLTADQADEVLEELRQELRYQQPHAFLIRRTKQDLALGLPPKTEVPVWCDMSAAERDLHVQLLRALPASGGGGKHFQALHRLSRLYQHPALLREWSASTVPELIGESPKLQRVLQTLHAIRAKGEKAIVFARHIDAQQLLQRVFEAEFRLRVPIINGSTSKAKGFTSSSGATQRAKNERKRILDAFRSQPGFGVLILSPFVAGIGLTITEANHVIHYGRWWNPAVESQATDRVYRIGQTQNVFVYLPILRDVSGQITKTFDERLNELLVRKLSLARDFLLPTTTEEDNEREMYSTLLADAESLGDQPTSPLTAADIDRLTPDDFEAVVAAVYRADGYQVVLTSKGGDAGADVLAIKPRECVIVQAKHSVNRVAVDDRALNDVIAACDVYSNQLGGSWKPVVVTNASMPTQTVNEARRLSIDLVTGDMLTRRIVARKIGHGHIARMDVERASSFADGLARARQFLTT